MAAKTRTVYENIKVLQKEVSQLKSFLLNKYYVQDEINSQLKVDIDQMKFKLKRFNFMKIKLNFLADRYKEQKVQVDLLVQLLRGQLIQHECKCGRKVNLPSNKMTENKPEQEGNDQNILETREAVKESCTDSPSDQKQESIKKIPNCVIKDARTNTVRISYTEEQKIRIGRSETNSLGQEIGPLECLNDLGQWRFAEATKNQISWLKISENIGILGRRLLLPVEMSGITINLVLCGRQLKTNEVTEESDFFKIKILAPGVRENRSIQLPVELLVGASIEKVNGQYSESFRHTFKIEKLSSLGKKNFAQPDNFCLSTKDLSQIKRPEIIFTFFSQ